MILCAVTSAFTRACSIGRRLSHYVANAGFEFLQFLGPHTSLVLSTLAWVRGYHLQGMYVACTFCGAYMCLFLWDIGGRGRRHKCIVPILALPVTPAAPESM